MHPNRKLKKKNITLLFYCIFNQINSTFKRRLSWTQRYPPYICILNHINDFFANALMLMSRFTQAALAHASLLLISFIRQIDCSASLIWSFISESGLLHYCYWSQQTAIVMCFFPLSIANWFEPMWSVHLLLKGPSQMYRASDAKLSNTLQNDIFCIFRTSAVILLNVTLSLSLSCVLGADVRPETSSTLFTFPACLMPDDETYKNTLQDSAFVGLLPLCVRLSLQLLSIASEVINSVRASQRLCIGNHEISAYSLIQDAITVELLLSEAPSD